VKVILIVIQYMVAAVTVVFVRKILVVKLTALVKKEGMIQITILIQQMLILVIILPLIMELYKGMKVNLDGQTTTRTIIILILTLII